MEGNPLRIGVDVGGTHTDAVLMAGGTVAASTKQVTSADVGSGVASAIRAVLAQSGVRAAEVSAVMIGTTHFTNALVERERLDEVGILRLASPSGEALPPLTGWPEDLAARIGEHVFLLPGGHEFDGREIAPFDEAGVREAARHLRRRGIRAVAVSSVFAPLDAAMERRAAAILREEHPEATITLSHAIGRLGLIERENAAILNAALTSLAGHVVVAIESVLAGLGIAAPLYISQNDGTLLATETARAYPVLTMGSGPTNSMRGAAFLSGEQEAMVVDVGGTTADIGVLTRGFPRECSIAVDIGGVRTNFRMPDILAIGLGGGTRIHLDPALYQVADPRARDLRIGPDSVGYEMTRACLFGGDTLTASDIAVAIGRADFGDRARIPALSAAVKAAIWQHMRGLFEDGIDHMKTAHGAITVLAVGGGHFLVPDGLKGVARVIRPPHAEVANAVGAAIAQVGASIERVVCYDTAPRETVLAALRQEAAMGVVAAGGDPGTVAIVDIDEVYLSYMPGRQAQVRLRAVSDLAGTLAAGRVPSRSEPIAH